jgi:hypothetical protein
LHVTRSGHDMNRHQQRVIGLILVGILTAGALVGGGWWLGQRSDRQPAASGVTVAPSINPPAAIPAAPDTSTTPAPPTGQARAGSWQRLPAAPIPGGSSPYAGVWTGNELLLHGPFSRIECGKYVGRSVGAAYQPATRTWRILPPAPGPVQNIEGGYQAVWTGRELLGWGMGLDAAYNPAANRWRRIAAGGSAWGVMVWTGRQVLTWGGGCCGEDVAGGAAYTPAADHWSRLPAAPLAGRQQTAGVWTGRELIVVGGNNTDGKVFADAAAYNPGEPLLAAPAAYAGGPHRGHGDLERPRGPGRGRPGPVQQPGAALCRRGGLQPGRQRLAAPARHGQRPHLAHRRLHRPPAPGMGRADTGG